MRVRRPGCVPVPWSVLPLSVLLLPVLLLVGLLLVGLARPGLAAAQEGGGRAPAESQVPDGSGPDADPVSGRSGTAALATDPVFLDLPLSVTVSGEQPVELFLRPDQEACRKRYGNNWWQPCNRNLGLNGQPGRGLSLAPAVEGKWRWTGDTHLTFVPARPWVPGQTSVLTFGPDALPAFVRLKRQQVQIAAEAFKPQIKGLRFLHDPGDLSRKVLSATLVCNYPVEPEALAARLAFVPEAAKGQAAPLAVSRPEVVWNQERTEATVSATVKDLPEKRTRVRLVLAKGLTARAGGRPAPELAQAAEVPGRGEFLRVVSSGTVLAPNERLEAEQVLTLSFSFKVPLSGLAERLHVGLLPRQKNQAAVAGTPYPWKNMAELTPEVLDRVEPLALSPSPGQDEAAPRRAFRFKAEPGRTLLVRVEAGLAAPGGYTLARDFVALVQAPVVGPELKLMQAGAVLPLTGEKKLTLQGRGLDAVVWEAARVRPEFVTHLITQSSGDFQSLDLSGEMTTLGDGEEFRLSGLGYDDISEMVRGEIPLARTDDRLPQFTSLDLAPLLGEGRRGLFRFTLKGRRGNATLEQADRRFVLVTDLALVVKENADRTREVFVASLSKAGPAPGARISVLGRNGLPVFQAEAGPDGRVALPNLSGLKREKEPVAVTAALGSDLAFLGWSQPDRRVDYSRFEVGGQVSRPGGLNACVFSQRGMYRPGDTLHFGYVVKPSDWKSAALAGLPLTAALRDPRGRTVREWTLALAADGFGELSHALPETASTGRYHLDLRLAKAREHEVLGSAGVMVHEFLPDSLAVRASLAPAAPKGWQRASGLAAEVSLSRLYGTPAAGHRVKGSLTLEPAVFRFPQYRGYTFHDAAPAQGPPVTAPLGERLTDDEGRAAFALNLEGFRRASSLLTVDLEGLDAESGRGVGAQCKVLVSPLAYLLGWRTDANLAFLRKGLEAAVEFIAVDPDLARAAAPGLTFAIGRVEHVSTLVFDQGRRKYRYDAVPRVRPLSAANRTVPVQGLTLPLPTAEPGDYLLTVLDPSGLELSRLPFTVAGHAPAALGQDKEGTLRVRLDREEYEAGQTVEVSIAAPFGGAGLITVERDRVAAHAWFTAPAGETVQKIVLPKDFEGRGYVNVSLFRSLDSREIFIKPHCYAVVPFTAGVRARDLGVQLAAPEEVKPGSRVQVSVSTRRPGRVLVFAVDEGILALTRYKTPDPVDFFLKNRALEVVTAQYLDLLMPEHSLVMGAIPAFGGDGLDPSALRQNPFKRKAEPPAVWWAGLTEVSATPRALDFELPPHYNGRLRLMAVGVSGDGVSAAERPLTVKGDLILTPHLPLAVSPGDEFTAAVSVGNHRAGSGKAAAVALSVDPGPALELVEAPPRTLSVDEGRESVASFRLKARDVLGETRVTLAATLGTARTERPVSLSLRPAAPRRSVMALGRTAAASQDVPVGRTLYPESARVEASASALPLPLFQAFAGYLEEYPFGCTEQVVSRAFPALLAARRPELVIPAPDPSPGQSPGQAPAPASAHEPSPARPRTPAEIRARAEILVQAAVATLAERRAEGGGFAMWPRGETAEEFVTLYAADFLLEASEAGFVLPGGLLDETLAAVRSLALRLPMTPEDARLRAYAAWTLTRSGQTTADILAGHMQAMDRQTPGWKRDVTGLLAAASARLMLQGRLAETLAAQYDPSPAQAWGGSGYLNGLAAQALALSALARQFPERLGSAPALSALGRLADTAARREYSTLSSALAARAVLDCQKALADRPEPVTLTALDASGRPQAKGRQEGRSPRLDGNAATTAFRFEGPPGLFWRVSTSGFDRVLPDRPRANGLELTRQFLDASGRPAAAVQLGDEISVVLTARSHGGEVANVALTSLLPGGFDLVLKPRPETLDPPPGVPLLHPDWTDRREDRLILFTTLTPREQAFVYRIKAASRGRFTTPPAAAEAMYDPALEALTTAGVIEVR